MFRIIIYFFLLFIFCLCKKIGIQKQSSRATSASIDSIGFSPRAHEQYIFDPETGTSNFSYNYSGIWDLDGDKQNDSLYFIGNGGAHIYFYPRAVLSSDKTTHNFPSAQLDMPWPETLNRLKKYGQHSAVQLTIHDFDNDGIVDIYLNLDHPGTEVPDDWQKQGVKTKYVLLSFARGRLNVRDYTNDPQETGSVLF
jgi:hypothetical protein